MLEASSGSSGARCAAATTIAGTCVAVVMVMVTYAPPAPAMLGAPSVAHTMDEQTGGGLSRPACHSLALGTRPMPDDVDCSVDNTSAAPTSSDADGERPVVAIEVDAHQVHNACARV